MAGAEQTILFLLALLPSVIIHEVMHGVVALHYGDDTAQRAGRLTLNPVPHIDPFGTLLLPLMLSLSGAGVFGYAKPVPVRPGNMRDPRNHGLIVSLAGPAINIVLAVVAALVLRVLIDPTQSVSLDSGSFAIRLVAIFGVTNVILAAFNLLPIPPLDGSAVIERFLPAAWLPGWSKLRRYSMGLLLVVVLAIPGALSGVFSSAISLWARLVV